MIMLPGSLVIALVLAVPDGGNPVGEATNLYRSSTLGFSLAFPASWEKFIPGTCGGGLPILDEDELLRLPVGPVSFKPSDQEQHIVYFHVAITRKYEETLASYIDKVELQCPARDRTVVDFNFGPGLGGKKIIMNQGWLSDEEPEGATYVLYALVVRGGLVLFDGRSPTKDFDHIERSFDSIANSLVLFQPLVDQGKPGTYKTYRGLGFSLDYPADWRVGRAYDDEKNRTAGFDHDLSITASSAELWWRWREPRIIVRRHPANPKQQASIEEFIADLETRLKSAKQLELEYADLETRDGRSGLRISYGFSWPSPFNERTQCIIYVLPTPDDRLQILDCCCPAEEFEELGPIFEHVGQSLKVREE